MKNKTRAVRAWAVIQNEGKLCWNYGHYHIYESRPKAESVRDFPKENGYEVVEVEITPIRRKRHGK